MPFPCFSLADYKSAPLAQFSETDLFRHDLMIRKQLAVKFLAEMDLVDE